MQKDDLKNLLNCVADGSISVDEAIKEIKMQPFEDMGFAKPDYHRGIRQGVAEVIYGAGKTKEQIKEIAKRLYESGQRCVLITRMSQEAADYINDELPFTYEPVGKTGIVGELPNPDGRGKIVIVTAGTSDIPVAKEAVATAKVLGNQVEEIYDVGVAGLHRLLSQLDKLMDAKVIIAIAGMEGALASVVGGLVDCPVIAVPTSVGYGASFGGISALLSMLNSCASGVSVVNIDNGFGAAYMASLINH